MTAAAAATMIEDTRKIAACNLAAGCKSDRHELTAKQTSANSAVCANRRKSTPTIGRTPTYFICARSRALTDCSTKKTSARACEKLSFANEKKKMIFWRICSTKLVSQTSPTREQKKKALANKRANERERQQKCKGDRRARARARGGGGGDLIA